MKIYDSIVIGAGPAGLSAAIYLGRFNRSVLIIDNGHGRSSFEQVNENYLGFPNGVKAKKLRSLGKKQAERFGAKFTRDKVITINQVSGSKQDRITFCCEGEKEKYCGKTVIIATGVTDLFPHFHLWEEYVGKSMFWCIVCDGYKCRNQRIAVIGENDDAVCTSLQFLNFTKDIVFITNIEKGHEEISKKWIDRLKHASIPYFPQSIKEVKGNNGYVEKLILADDTELAIDLIFNEQGSIPNYELVKDLGIELNEEFFIKTDEHQRTNIPGVYAAGDNTSPYSHQIITAAFEGSTAAITANYDLYEPFQKHEG